MAKTERGNKHTEVTAASLMRRARAHRKYAKHRMIMARADGKKLFPGGPVITSGVIHEAVAWMHRDTAEILLDEARELRAQR